MKSCLFGVLGSLGLAFAQASSVAGAGDEHTLSLVVRARARGCAGHAGTRDPLHWSDALTRAAGRMDRGEAALGAVEQEGYRATRVFHANFTGYRSAEEAVDGFSRHYCSSLVEPRFSDFGFYRSGNHWLFVLATPLEVPQLADPKAVASKVLALTNEARSHARRCGDQAFDAAPAVRWSPQLEHAAAQHAQDMAAHAYLEHRGRDGSTPAQRVSRAGYRWRSVGENVASGQVTPEDVVDDWLRSPGHCANLMNAEFTEMGVAYGVNMKAGSVVFWAQSFGRPR